MERGENEDSYAANKGRHAFNQMVGNDKLRTSPQKQRGAMMNE